MSAQTAAGRDLERRGLYGWSGLRVGQLRRDFITREGRTLARAGALCIFITGPDGQVCALKVRNIGTADELRAAGLDRYVYRIGGHGAPAWCSPGYGQGKALLITEGELNGAAASLAAEVCGLSLDVQGLAGAGGTPFLDGIEGRVVFLYADGDTAGLSCLERLGKLAQRAGAAEVRVLAFLQSGDFCDMCSGLGVAVFGAQLQAMLSSADLGARSDLSPTAVPNKTLSGTVPSIWGQRSTPSRSIWGIKRGLL